jgi:D-serine deaminase-like pyridoxal phosphate-dependent protein
MTSAPWFRLVDIDDIPTPALIVYRARVDENLRRMVTLAGGVDRLRPHVKTHKVPQVVQRQLAQGINRFKCATIAEAEMTAGAGAADVLLAYQPVGPNITRLAELTRRFPRTRFSALVDNESSARALSTSFSAQSLSVDLLLDLDVGMHRSGLAPDAEADRLYALVTELPGVRAGGLHAYDGHIRDGDAAVRKVRCDQAFEGVSSLAARLEAANLSVPEIVAGGTPTFPIHASRAGVTCSPGTCVYWDAGYGSALDDLDFLQAALVLTRVVSRPGARRVCLDLGHKAIASENPHPRVVLFGPSRDGPLAGTFVAHSEEHLVLETDTAPNLSVGDALFGVPWHICPTVALHAEALVVDDGRVVDRWMVQARARRLSI